MQADIDFEVFKALTAMRRDERDSINDVVRRLVGLCANKTEPESRNGAELALQPCLVFKGVEFPAGTKFRSTYKGKVYLGEVIDGKWNDEVGNTYNSPSQAAHAVTGSGVNGWNFWECRRPADSDWVRLGSLRSG